MADVSIWRLVVTRGSSLQFLGETLLEATFLILSGFKNPALGRPMQTAQIKHIYQGFPCLWVC